MARVSIHGAEYPIEKVFSDDFAFTIPRYQRPYAWTTNEAGELLDDLVLALGDEIDVEDANPYFLGSVVLIKSEKPDAEVIDGQQRLTTLTILLSAIRHLLPKAEAADITSFIYEKENRIKGTPNRYRLTIRERDAEFFQKHVQIEGGLDELAKTQAQELKDSRKNIRDNTSLFVEKLKGMDEGKQIRLAQFVAKRCFLVVVSTPDLDSAYRIFSVLNDRGLDLSHADILKAEIIGKVSLKQQDDYTQKWEDLEDELGRDVFADLFAHIRMIYRKSKLKETVLKEVREYVKPAANPSAFIDNTLSPMADAYEDIRSAAYESTEHADEINAFLRWLHMVDNIDWQPPAILYFSKFKNDPAKLLAFVKDLERLATGLMVIRMNITDRIVRYGKLLEAIEKGQDLSAGDSPLQLSDAERARVISNLDGKIYEEVKIRLPVLLRLDSTLSAGGAKYDLPIITVEHVLPQNPHPTSGWISSWPDNKSA